MYKIKGFTLVELLIVVVIIAILAALILPRFLSQPERMVIAEGTQMLGVLRRAQIAYNDLTNSDYLDFDIYPSESGSVTTDEWRTLGMAPLPAASKFSYSCGPLRALCSGMTGDSACCFAQRTGGDYQMAAIAIRFDTGAIKCGPIYGTGKTYVEIGDGKGCTTGEKLE